jgi:GNAT superfamily N-acetyltransferase
MTEIRLMGAEHEPVARDLFRAAHPGWPEPVASWFIAYPTLLAWRGDQPVGYTQFSMNMTDTGYLVMYGQDLYVSPEARGQGLGMRLQQKRLEIARDLGAVAFAGVTAPDNAAMLAIFKACGAVPLHQVPGYYRYDTPPRDGIIHMIYL